MTREEAYIRAEELNSEIYPYGVDTYTLVTNIYDSFESRTCSSCKHYLQHQCQNGAVDAMLDPAKEMVDNVKVEPDFGCNKWQQKD